MKLFEQTRQSQVQDAESLRAGLVPESTGDKCFSRSGRASDEDAEMFADVCPAAELREQGAVEIPFFRRID